MANKLECGAEFVNKQEGIGYLVNKIFFYKYFNIKLLRLIISLMIPKNKELK